MNDVKGWRLILTVQRPDGTDFTKTGYDMSGDEKYDDIKAHQLADVGLRCIRFGHRAEET